MNDTQSLDPKALTFSQAQGYESLPVPLKLEEVSPRARQAIWNLLYVFVDEDHKRRSTYSFYESRWTPIFYVMHREILLQTVEYFNSSNHYDNLRKYRDMILEELSFNKLFGMLQLIVREPSCPREFTVSLARTFEDNQLAYIIDVEAPPTILPAVTSEEGARILAALQELHQGSLLGAVEHLKRAAECINSRDWGGSIRESIHSVESVARLLDTEAASTLGPALASLEERGGLHPALKKAFGNLYGYTSDEQGIRHALLDDAATPAGPDEAVFMLGACASFASYLWRRHQGGEVG